MYILFTMCTYVYIWEYNHIYEYIFYLDFLLKNWEAETKWYLRSFPDELFYSSIKIQFC